MSSANQTRRRLLKSAVAVPAAALGGCVAMPYGPYYRPSSSLPGATLKGAWCNGVAGPKSNIEVPLAPDVTLTARAERDYLERDRPELPLRLTITLPARQPARFANARLAVIEASSGKALGGEPQVHAFRYASLPADAWVDPARVRPSGAAGVPLKADAPNGSARVRVSLEPGFTPDRLQVDGVAIALDRSSISMPAVAMNRPASKFGVRDYRSPELHASLEQRAARCRQETPKLACENIVEHSSFSFDTEDANARWAGRWYVAGDGPGARIEGEVNFALRTASRWRAASNTITVRGVAGDSRIGRFSQIDLALNDRIALDTPLFAGPVDGTGHARVSIEIPLPGAPSDFEIVLPDLQLGSSRIGVAPIRFERRTFDGGLEPFNC